MHISEIDELTAYEIETAQYGVQSDVEYSLDILCIMALADAFGLEYGGFVN